MDIVRSLNGGTKVIKLRGRFDILTINQFGREASEQLDDQTTQELEVDLGGVIYLDSSAVGALLVLRDQAKRAGKSISISRAHGTVRRTLNNMCIDQLIPVN